MMLLIKLFFTCLLVHLGLCDYTIDSSNGLGPKFDGIGGLSAGASSCLLPSYDEKYSSQILDLLFKPNFAASLQILKVEIGGDGQSTDGTESSHMHSENDENYSSGYEWWLMTEAKKRNPDIKLYGLPWTFPAWLGVDSNSPYAHPNVTANYILKWIKGAKQYYNLTIDYIGIWNERNFDATYIKTLRKTLDSGGYNNMLIVAPDGSFSSIANAVLKDKELSDAVSILGAHYPGTNSPDNAKQTGKTLWSSEDFSTYNDDTGAGCWARILNQNYVNGGMTSTITWNLIASYYEGLPFYGDGLMTAAEPWSGHYDINGPIYVTAHTTQFTTTDYHYLKVGSGSGHLQNGGSYVSFTDSKSMNLTIVIETMSHDHSKCIRPSLPSYSVTSQTATFILMGDFARISELCVWDSQLFPSDGVSGPQYFIKNGTIKVVNGKFEVFLPVDHVTTLSTTCDRTKGEYTPPPSGSFPTPYTDDFNSYKEYSEAKYFADQAGVYEISKSKMPSLGMVMKQVVTEHVISWCRDAGQTITVFGQHNWSSAVVSVDLVLPDVHDVSTSVSGFIAARVSGGGCGTPRVTGIFFWVSTSGTWTLTSDLGGSKVITSGKTDIKPDTIVNLGLSVQAESATLSINGTNVANNVSIDNGQGFVAMGTSGYFPAEFDNFKLQSYNTQK